MRTTPAIGALSALLCLTACSDSRLDPCKLLSVPDAQSLDGSVVSSLWAGRGEPKTDDEVCMFYNAAGAPRMMLFVWYENDSTPKERVAEGSRKTDVSVTELDLPTGNLRGAASFQDEALALLALQSDRRTIGFRVREPVRRDSEEFETLLELSQAALARF